MQVSFDPLQNSIPEGLRDHLQSSKSKADRLRWMALAGANLPNSDQLVLLQLLRSRHASLFRTSDCVASLMMSPRLALHCRPPASASRSISATRSNCFASCSGNRRLRLSGIIREGLCLNL